MNNIPRELYSKLSQPQRRLIAELDAGHILHQISPARLQSTNGTIFHTSTLFALMNKGIEIVLHGNAFVLAGQFGYLKRRKELLALIHILARDMGMDDSQRHKLQLEAVGVKSCEFMSMDKLEDALHALNAEQAKREANARKRRRNIIPLNPEDYSDATLRAEFDFVI